jgi:hypothetical protein
MEFYETLTPVRSTVCAYPHCPLIMDAQDGLLVGNKLYCYDHHETVMAEKTADDYINSIFNSSDESACCGYPVSDDGRCENCWEAVR